MTATYTECRACDGEGGAEGNVLTFERETGAPICEWIVCGACGGRGEVRETVRLIDCRSCGGDGEFTSSPIAPSGHGVSRKCCDCNGTGKEEIEAEPITQDDMDEFYASADFSHELPF